MKMVEMLLFRLAIASMLTSTAAFAYWLWLDDPAIITEQAAVIENPSPIRAGDTLLVRSRFCQSLEAIPESGVRQIRNAYVHDLADHTVISRPGCGGRAYALPLPQQLMPGPHTFAFSLSYRVNPIKTKTIVLPEVPFMVEP